MDLFRRKSKNIFFRIFKKKNLFEKIYYKNKEFIDYCLVSLICTGILYLLFFFVDLLSGGNYILANFISYTISFTVLYIWDKKIFKSKPIRKKDKLSQLTSFVLVRIIGFPLDSLILSFLIKKFMFGNMTAKILSSFIMFIYNYITNKLFVFKKNKLI